MRVILLQDIENIGKKYDVKEVKSGYARNFLIPKGLARQVTKATKKWVELQREIIEKRSEQELEKIQKKASAIDGTEVIIPVKVGEKDQLFESVTPQKIVERLKEMGIEVKKAQINLQKPIKELGDYSVKIKFEHNLESDIKVIITEKKE